MDDQKAFDESQVKPLFKKQYQKEDFFTLEPYDELYENRNNQFLQGVMIDRMRDRAKEVGFRGFTEQWKRYLRSKRTDIQQDDIGQDTMFEDQPIQLRCGSYTCAERVTRINEYGIEVEVISHPLMPVKRVTNIETFEAKLEIAFCRGRRDPWKHLMVTRKQLASAQQIINLADMDIDVNSENAKEVVKYMSMLESKNYDELPRVNAVSHMGWLSDGQFMPYVTDVSYDGESPEFYRMYTEFKPTGNESTWLELAKSIRGADSLPARIALAASFSAPLVHILGGLSFFVHFWGDAGCGKTVGLMLAASVWGNPDVGRYVKTFAGTKVSQELYAAFCCNLPVLFDELQVISDKKTFDDIIYMLCEGVSKGRALKEGGLQVQRRWSSCIITTGEMPITQSNSGGGAMARTIEINFGGVPLFKDARSVANTLKEHYGFAGPKFIQMLQQEGVIDALKSLQRKYYAELIKEDIHDKQVLSASILLAADALATKGIFKDNRGLTIEDIKGYLKSRTATDANLRCYQWLLGFCAANPRRFDSQDQNNGEVWGKYEDGYVWINKTIFEEQLKNKGFSPGAFLDWAKRKDMLKYKSYGSGSSNNRLTIRLRVGGQTIPHVVLKLPKEEKTEQEEYREYVEVNDPDMPF